MSIAVDDSHAERVKKRERRKNTLEKIIGHLKAQLQRLDRLHNRYSWYRVIAFLTGVLLGIPLYWVHTGVSGGVIFFSVLAFTLLAHHHTRIEKSQAKHEIWLKIKATQLARMKLDWENIPCEALRSSESEHPFDFDLDITGRHSLYQLIDITISREGRELLKDWLLQRTPEPAAIRRRQAVIKELAGLPGFRDQLLLNFKLISDEQLEGKRFLEVLCQPRPTGTLTWILPVSALLAFTNLALFGFYWAGWIPALWVYSLTLYVIIYFMNQNALKHIFNDVQFLDEELNKIKAILNYLETYPYAGKKHLWEWCKDFRDSEKWPSRHLRRIRWVMLAIGLRMNPGMTVLLNLLVPWDLYFTTLLEKRKSAFANRLSGWLPLWAELEALISLANFAWLNPQYIFPELQENPGVFEAKQIGHPLLPYEQKVCNDFSINRPGEIVLITGSNMAGKSTFLKTLGINLVLAYAGGPVNARFFRTALFRVFSSIKVSDSVTEGFSFFYAEVRRLKALLTELRKEDAYPLFFLIDEIFKGTNNRERFIGSRSYIQESTGRNGIGIIATHDLELTLLEKQFPSVSNFHFREEVVDGKMVFDYQLRPGPCPTTNALIIMRMEGLPVNE